MTLEVLQRELLKVGGVSFTALGLMTAAVSFILVFVFAILVNRLLARGLSKVAIVEESERYAISRIAYYLIIIFGALACLEGLGIAIGRPFLTLGGTSISLFSLSTFAALTALVLVGSQIAGRAVANQLLNRSHFDEGLRYAIGRITYYVLLVTGMMAALQTIGVQLGSLTVLIGALGVGIGFGLQNIVNNFVSGLILLIERPIKVGDWVDLSGTSGRVTNIGARSTTVVTPDNITIILPNGDCLANQIINWSFGDTRIRFRIPVGVAYGSDMDKVQKALLEAGAKHPSVLEDPAPKVLFDAFGDSSLNLELAVWIKAGSIGAQQLRSDLNFAIDRNFRAADIEIPFPQRDLHFRNLLNLSN